MAPRSIRSVFMLVAILSYVATADAYIVLYREPVINKTAIAESIVIARVVASQPDPVTARLYRHHESTSQFRVFTVEVRETLLGPKMPTARMAFIAWKVKSGEYKSVPAVGDEGIYFAVKTDRDLWVIPSGCYIAAKEDNYAGDLAIARRCACVTTRPDEFLDSKDPSDRLLAAAMLVLRGTYTPIRYGASVMKPAFYPPEQSRQIMTILADADWAKPDAATAVAPRTILGWLQSAGQPTGTDWSAFPRRAATDAELVAAQKQWLRDHTATFRLKRLVLKDASDATTRPGSQGAGTVIHPARIVLLSNSGCANIILEESFGKQPAAKRRTEVMR
jgi:hypothetical protein